MAEKALFHTVSMKNGYKEWWQIVPAQSAEHAKSHFQTCDIAVTDVTCLGWCLVELDWDGSDVVFRANADGNNCYFEPGVFGYDYLMSYFHVDVSRMMQDVRDAYDY
ncbi:hypothetical protein ABK988_19010 [Vibrio parahaemolyticus]